MQAFALVPPAGRGLPVSAINVLTLRETIKKNPEFWAGFILFNVRGRSGAEVMRKADVIAHSFEGRTAWQIHYNQSGPAPVVRVRMMAGKRKARSINGLVAEIQADGSMTFPLIPGGI